MSMIIFLDIDGVLVPVSPYSFGGGDLEDSCLQKLREIVDLCGEAPIIVLSSTWRHDEDKKKRLAAAFGKFGIPLIHSGVPDGVPNPSTVTYLKKDPDEQKLVRDRADEITYWLETHSKEFPVAALGRWIVIDDMKMGSDPRIKSHFIHTDIEEGLLSSDVAKAKEIVASLPEYIPPSSSGVDEVAAGNSLPENVELEGVVKRYNSNRGFGFITCQNTDVFVHQSGIKHEGFRGLNMGQPVKFVYKVNGKVKEAVDVVQLTEYTSMVYLRKASAEKKKGESAPSESKPSKAVKEVIVEKAKAKAAPKSINNKKTEVVENRKSPEQQKSEKPASKTKGRRDDSKVSQKPATEPVQKVAGEKEESKSKAKKPKKRKAEALPKRPMVPFVAPNPSSSYLVPHGMGWRAHDGTVFYIPPPMQNQESNAPQ